MSKKNDFDVTGFDWFEDRGARITDSFISISGDGTFILSSGFIHEIKMDRKNKNYVKFGYNKSKDLIAFNFTTDDRDKGVYTVVLRGEKAKSGSVTSRAFFKKNNLDSKKLAGRYSPELKKIARLGECWIIDFNERLEK